MDSSEDDTTVGVSLPPGLTAVSSRFEILGVVGEGGMGIVYRARDRHTGDMVALKILRPTNAADPAQIERFKKELLLARRITHKNVCRVHDLIDAGGTAVISMELVSGETLRALLRQVGSVSVQHGMRLLRQVIAGLAEAHAQGVVHRDLKPENILIGRDGIVKVMDFGIARALDASDTSTGTLLGTPAYMSPEQADGGIPDARGDIYALGLLMFEMFCGRPAFRADTPAALIAKQVNDAPPPPREIDPDVPPRIERAILKCLEKNPDRRFQSVGDVEAALDEKPVAPVSAGGTDDALPDHLARWQRTDWLVGAAALAGLVVFFTCTAWTSLAPRSQVAFNRSLLRRIVREHLGRLGVPVEPGMATRVGFGGASYVYVAQHAGAAAARDLTNNPVHYWSWIGEQGSTRVVVDNRGELVAFSRRPDIDGPLPRLDDSRILAEKALADFYKRAATDLTVDRAGSDGRVNSFNWLNPAAPYGLRETYAVEMDAKGIATLSRSILPPADFRSREPAQEDWGTPVAIALGVIMSILGFRQRDRLNAATGWRTSLCALGFLTGFGLALSMHDYWTGSGSTFPLSVAVGVLMAVLWLLTSMAVEKQLLKDGVARLHTFVWFFGGRLAAQPCGLAVLRGTLIGLGLLGIDSVGVWLSTTYGGARLHHDVHLWFLGWLLNGTDWPVAVLLSWVAGEAIGIGLIVTFVDSVGCRLIRPGWLSALAGAVFLAICGLHNTIGSIQPFYWTMMLLALDYALLILVLRRFDMLTLVVALFTFAFWWGNYPLYVMLHSVTVQPTIAFALWGSCVVAATAIAFKSTVRSTLRRMAAAVE